MTVNLKPRQRDTSSVQRRAENLRNLINHLGNGPMAADEFATFLSFSASGTRKYIKDLRDGLVIEVSHYDGAFGKFLGHPVWRLSDNMEARKAFIDSLSVPTRRRGPTVRKITADLADPTRHFHVMADDIHYSIKLSRAPVVRDPMVAALFGPAKVSE